MYLCVLPSNLRCMCPYVYLHIQAHLSVHGFGEVDILHRSEMREPPLGCLHPPPHPPSSVYPLGSLVFLPANHCCCCHLLYFMCLVHSSLSAPNAFVCVSSLFYLQIPPCHHKKVRRHSISHLWIPIHFQMGAVWVRCSLCVCAHSQFLLMRWKNISWCRWCWFQIESSSVSVTEQSVWLLSQSLTPTDT